MQFFQRYRYSLLHNQDDAKSSYKLSKNKILACIVLVASGCFIAGALASEALKSALNALQQPPPALACKIEQEIFLFDLKLIGYDSTHNAP